MPMIEEMEQSGGWLFRWRGWLPLVTVLLLFAGLKEFVYPFESHRWDQIWELACLVVSLGGFAVRLATVGFVPPNTSGRNRRRQIADTLNTAGMYSIVRNPLYLGNFLIGLGVSLLTRVWWVSLIYMLLFMLYYERIIFAEEMFLRRKFGQAYIDWATTTPMFLPRPRLWRSPAHPLNVKKLLRQEHQSLGGIVLAFYLVEFVTTWKTEHTLFSDPLWNVLAGLTVICFLVIRFLYKHTTLLDDDPNRLTAN